MKPNRSLPLLALLPLLGSSASAQEWTRFRGPNGSGVAAGEGLPAEFGPEQNLAWRAEVPYASSSPVVSGDAVYVTASTEEELLVLCLERADGGVRWRRELERAHDTEIYPANDSASPTPVTDGENVYAFFPELGLVSYDSKGELRWTHPLSPFVSFYGMAASPILAGDALILLCDQQQGSYLLAVDTESGERLWRTERTGMIESWTTPALHPAQAPDTVVVFGSFFICGYSLETGAETWRMKGLGYTPVCSPIVDGDRIYASVPYHAEQPLPGFDALLGSDANEDGKLAKDELGESPLAAHFGWADADKDGLIDAKEWEFVVAGMSSRDHGLVAIDLEHGDAGVAPVERWRHKRALPSIATPLLYDGVLYLVKHGGIVTSLDAASGEVLKSERLADGGAEYNASPVGADGKVFLAGSDGNVTVLKAGAQWEVVSTHALGEGIAASPAIAGGDLFVRTRSTLLCFRESSPR